MSRLGVVGNISIDHGHRIGLPSTAGIGGAALHVALAAARAGLTSRPISVVGPDLDMIRCDPQVGVLDLSGIKTVDGRSAVFTLNYDHNDVLVSSEADYGVSTHLTAHALDAICGQRDTWFHVCCRRPLDIATVLDAVVRTAAPFSLDFFLPSAAESIAAAATALPHAHLVFANAAEYDLITTAVPVRALREVVLTDGPRPVKLLRSGRCLAWAVPPQVRTVDVTGSGDTLAGTFLAAKAMGLDDASALERGACAASAHAASSAFRLN